MFKKYSIEDIIRIRSEEARDEGLETGRAEGIRILIRTCREFQLPREEVSRKVSESFGLTPEQVEPYLIEQWDCDGNESPQTQKLFQASEK